MERRDGFDDDRYPAAPLPAHERTWRHPSEVGQAVWVQSEPPMAIGRGLLASITLVGGLLAVGVLWAMLSTHPGSTARPPLDASGQPVRAVPVATTFSMTVVGTDASPAPTKTAATVRQAAASTIADTLLSVSSIAAADTVRALADPPATPAAPATTVPPARTPSAAPSTTPRAAPSTTIQPVVADAPQAPPTTSPPTTPTTSPPTSPASVAPPEPVVLVTVVFPGADGSDAVAVPILDGQFALTTSDAAPSAGAELAVRLPGGDTGAATVVLVGQGDGISVIRLDRPLRAVPTAESPPAVGDVLRLAGHDATVAAAVRDRGEHRAGLDLADCQEGTPVVDGSARLVGLCHADADGSSVMLIEAMMAISESFQDLPGVAPTVVETVSTEAPPDPLPTEPAGTVPPNG